MKPWAKIQQGAEGVEFALVLPVLLLLIFGIVQFGWLFNNYLTLATAANAGARVLAAERGYTTPYSDAKSAIQASSPLLKNTMTITMKVGGTTCNSDTTCATALGTSTQPPAAGTQASVALGYTFTPLFQGSVYGLKSMMPSSLTATMSENVQ